MTALVRSAINQSDSIDEALKVSSSSHIDLAVTLFAPGHAPMANNYTQYLSALPADYSKELE
jgi:hypothetical protein